MQSTLPPLPEDTILKQTPPLADDIVDWITTGQLGQGLSIGHHLLPGSKQPFSGFSAGQAASTASKAPQPQPLSASEKFIAAMNFLITQNMPEQALEVYNAITNAHQLLRTTLEPLSELLSKHIKLNYYTDEFNNDHQLINWRELYKKIMPTATLPMIEVEESALDHNAIDAATPSEAAKWISNNSQTQALTLFTRNSENGTQELRLNATTACSNGASAPAGMKPVPNITKFNDVIAKCISGNRPGFAIKVIEELKQLKRGFTDEQFKDFLHTHVSNIWETLRLLENKIISVVINQGSNPEQWAELVILMYPSYNPSYDPSYDRTSMRFFGLRNLVCNLCDTAAPAERHNEMAKRQHSWKKRHDPRQHRFTKDTSLVVALTTAKPSSLGPAN